MRCKGYFYFTHYTETVRNEGIIRKQLGHRGVMLV